MVAGTASAAVPGQVGTESGGVAASVVGGISCE